MKRRLFSLDFVNNAKFEDSNVLMLYGIVFFKVEHFVAD
jgi:hypothetical protein